MNDGKAVDVFYLDFSKALDIISHHILLHKVAAHGLDGGTAGKEVWVAGTREWC